MGRHINGRKTFCKKDGLPTTNIGWAEYYTNRFIKEPTNTQAETLGFLHLLFHFSRDLPQAQFESPMDHIIAEVVQDQFQKCIANYGYLRNTLTEQALSLTEEQLRAHHANTFKKGSPHAAVPNESQRHSLSM